MQEARNILVNEYMSNYTKYYRVGIKVTHNNKPLVDDAMQVLFLRLEKKKMQQQEIKSAISSYIIVSLINCIRTLVNRQKKEVLWAQGTMPPSMEPTSTANPLEERLADEQLVGLIDHFISNELPRKQASVLRLWVDRAGQLAEAAQDAGIRHSKDKGYETFRAHNRYAIIKLRKFLNLKGYR